MKLAGYVFKLPTCCDVCILCRDGWDICVREVICLANKRELDHNTIKDKRDDFCPLIVMDLKDYEN